jgi:hypothetical protein
LLIFHESFPSYPRLFSSKNEEISAPPPCGFLIGIYLFYENWSTETSRKNESNRWVVYYTKPANLFINLDWRLLPKIWYTDMESRLEEVFAKGRVRITPPNLQPKIMLRIKDYGWKYE